ncbi:unnamed protein product, partial [Symbiodinium pilosum]
MAKAGHLDMLVEDWDMVPKYWAEYCQEHRAHPVARLFFYVAGFRGDWKALKQVFNFDRRQGIKNCSLLQVCWKCSATKGSHDVADVACAFTDTRGCARFWADLHTQCPWKYLPAYATLPGFEISAIVPDLLHVWHLGVGRDVLGSSLAIMLSNGVFGPGSAMNKLMEATNRLRRFASSSGYSLRLKKLTKNKLNWKQRCYPELKSSGYDTFVVHQWVMNELHTFPESLPADLIACLWASNHFLSIWTNAGRWLSPAEHANVKEAGKIFTQAYCALAKKAARDQVRLYKVRPKLHLLHHLARQETRKNPHYFATWMDEDGLKKLVKVLKLSDARSAEKRLLQRWLLGLPDAWKQ